MIVALCDGCRAEVPMYDYLLAGGLNNPYYCATCKKARATPPAPPTDTAA